MRAAAFLAAGRRAFVALRRAGPARFASLKKLLPGITPRALTQCLKSLQEVDVLERAVGDDYPPTVHYSLLRKGKLLATRLVALVEGCFAAP